MVTVSFINRLSHAVDVLENRSQVRPFKVVTVRRGYHEEPDVAEIVITRLIPKIGMRMS